MMSMKCKYALKALIRLGMEKEKGSLRTEYIASAENIPKKFLEQILLDLKHGLFVGSRQGSKGGYYLLKEPGEINVADIHRHFDGAIALLPCAAVQYYEKCDDCTDEATCVLKREFTKIKDRTREIMKQTTIASFIENAPKSAKKGKK